MAGPQLRELGAAFEIGSHTRDHAYASRMNAATWALQVTLGKEMLEQELGRAVQGFCYPGGKRTSRSTQAVEAAGFAYARTAENLRTDCGTDTFLMPTSLQFYPHSRSVVLRNFVSHGHWRHRVPLAAACLMHGNFERRLRHAFDVALSTGQGFHLWGHSWEIENLHLWPMLERFFADVQACVAPADRPDNAGVLRAAGLLPEAAGGSHEHRTATRGTRHSAAAVAD